MSDTTFQPGSIDYNGRIATNYPAARGFSPETADLWSGIVEPFIPLAYPATVLDLGCGTGRFSNLFAERFATRVIGLDPAVAMLRAATQGRTSHLDSWRRLDRHTVVVLRTSADPALW